MSKGDSTPGGLLQLHDQLNFNKSELSNRMRIEDSNKDTGNYKPNF